MLKNPRRHGINPERLNTARKEIEDLKLEIQSLIKPTMKAGDNLSQNKEINKANILANVEVNGKAKVVTILNKIKLPSPLKKPLSKNIRKSTTVVDEKPIITEITSNTKNYDRKSMQDFIKKQRQVRKDKLHEEEKQKRETEELRKKKLQVLQQKTVQLVNENIKRSQRRSKSRSIDVNKRASVPNLDKLDQFTIDRSRTRSQINDRVTKRTRCTSADRESHEKPWRRTRCPSQETKTPDVIKVKEAKTTVSPTEKPATKVKDQNIEHVCMDRNTAASKIQSAFRNFHNRKESSAKNDEIKNISNEDESIENKNVAEVLKDIQKGSEINKFESKNNDSNIKIKSEQTAAENTVKIDEISSHNLPIWLQAPTTLPYPYNFITAVKRKLDIVTGNVPKSQNVAVQSTPEKGRDVSIQNTISKKSNEFVREIKISTIPQLNSPHLQDSKNFLSHKSQMKITSTVPVLKSPILEVRAISNNGEISDNVEKLVSDTDSDTTKNIPEISDEESNVKEFFSLKSDSESTQYLKHPAIKTSLHNLPLSSNAIKDLELKVGKTDSSKSAKSSSTIKTDTPKKNETSNISKYPSDIESILSHYSKKKNSNNSKSDSYSDDFNSSKCSTKSFISGVREIISSEAESVKKALQFPSLSKNLSLSKKNNQPESKIKINENNVLVSVVSSSIKEDIKNISTLLDSKTNSNLEKRDNKTNIHSTKSITEASEILEDINESSEQINLRNKLFHSSGDRKKLTSPIPLKIPDSLNVASKKAANLAFNSNVPLNKYLNAEYFNSQFKYVLQTSNLENLVKPTVNLNVEKENFVADTKTNSKEIHLKFQAEMHLLNSFNNSLQQFIAIDQSLYGDQDKENKNIATQNDEKIPEDRSVLSTINYRRGCDFTEDNPLVKTSSHVTSDQGDCSKEIEITNMEKLLSTTVNSVASRQDDSFSASKEPYASFSIDMYDELIKDEDKRLEHLKAVLRLRDKALLDRTKGELAWLEMRKKQLRDSGQLNDVTLIKKKQRGLIIKLEQERHEMQRLKQAHKQASKQRKIALKEQKNMIKHQLSSTDEIPAKIRRISRSDRRQSGPMKVYRLQAKTEHVSHTTLSCRSSEETVNVTSSSVVTHISENITSDADLNVQSTKTALVDTEKVQKSLLMREAALQRRRREAERLLAWHRRLQDEEARVAALERRANSITYGRGTGTQPHDIAVSISRSPLDSHISDHTHIGVSDRSLINDQHPVTFSINTQSTRLAIQDANISSSKQQLFSDGRLLTDELTDQITDCSIISSKTLTDIESKYKKNASLQSEEHLKKSSSSKGLQDEQTYSLLPTLNPLQQRISSPDLDEVLESLKSDINIEVEAEEKCKLSFESVTSKINELSESIKSEITEFLKSEIIETKPETNEFIETKLSETTSEIEENSQTSESSPIVAHITHNSKTSFESEIKESIKSEIRDKSENSSTSKSTIRSNLEEEDIQSKCSNTSNIISNIDNKNIHLMLSNIVSEQSASENSDIKLESKLSEIRTTENEIYSSENELSNNKTLVIISDNESKMSNIISEQPSSEKSDKNHINLDSQVSEVYSIGYELSNRTISDTDNKNVLSKLSNIISEQPISERSDKIYINFDSNLSAIYSTEPELSNNISRTISDTDNKNELSKLSNIISEQPITEISDKNYINLDSKVSEIYSTEPEFSNNISKTISISDNTNVLSKLSNIVSEQPITGRSDKSHTNLDSKVSEIYLSEPEISNNVSKTISNSDNKNVLSKLSNIVSEQSITGRSDKNHSKLDSKVSEIYSTAPELSNNISKTISNSDNKNVFSKLSNIVSEQSITGRSDKNHSKLDSKVSKIYSSDTDKENAQILDTQSNNLLSQLSDINSAQEHNYNNGIIFQSRLSEIHTTENKTNEELDTQLSDNNINSKSYSDVNSQSKLSERTTVENELTSNQFSFDIKQSDDNIIVEITNNYEKPNENNLETTLSIPTDTSEQHSDIKTDSLNISSNVNTTDIDDEKYNTDSKVFNEISSKTNVTKSSNVRDSNSNLLDEEKNMEINMENTNKTVEDKCDKLVFDLKQPYRYNEAEELLRKQLEIEQEIKRLEQQQQQQQQEEIPYCFVREIPNKPPPPYKPPELLSNVRESSTAVLPSSVDSVTSSTSVIPTQAGQIKSFVSQAVDVLYSKRNSNDMLSSTDANSDVTPEKFVFDLCKEIAFDIYRPNNDESNLPSWRLSKNNKFSNMLSQRKPRTKMALEVLMSERVLGLLNIERPSGTVNRKDNLIIRWSRKRRDHVDEILVSESQTEETDWVNYDTDEITIKQKLTDDILSNLIDETISVITNIMHQRKTLCWFS